MGGPRTPKKPSSRGGWGRRTKGLPLPFVTGAAFCTVLVIRRRSLGLPSWFVVVPRCAFTAWRGRPGSCDRRSRRRCSWPRKGAAPPKKPEKLSHRAGIADGLSVAAVGWSEVPRSELCFCRSDVKSEDFASDSDNSNNNSNKPIQTRALKTLLLFKGKSRLQH